MNSTTPILIKVSTELHPDQSSFQVPIIRATNLRSASVPDCGPWLRVIESAGRAGASEGSGRWRVREHPAGR